MNAPEITRTIAKDGATPEVIAAFAALPEKEREATAKAIAQDYPEAASAMGIAVASKPEPATVTADSEPPKGQLPDDFPGRVALRDASINTYGQLAKFADDYTKIPGIGAATAAKITETIGGN